ncbi:hypothetical protein SKAU_G00257360 [Synaphobranchus kaupii]|uniref:Uncharacterized protein n=1 Tax=Synaphobranchus kaupii TaxID=118154 RepID=A0A9Q1F481_SYNKA|nr:hypothetical protein SKAU_G00257360 [Synaphobranchus kaupii]
MMMFQIRVLHPPSPHSPARLLVLIFSGSLSRFWDSTTFVVRVPLSAGLSAQIVPQISGRPPRPTHALRSLISRENIVCAKLPPRTTCNKRPGALWEKSEHRPHPERRSHRQRLEETHD